MTIELQSIVSENSLWNLKLEYDIFLDKFHYILIFDGYVYFYLNPLTEVIHCYK